MGINLALSREPWRKGTKIFVFSSLRRRVWKTKTKIRNRKTRRIRANPTQIKRTTLPKRTVIVVSTALTIEGRDTPVFWRGEIFHTIFISSSRARNILYGKCLLISSWKTHTFISFHQFCIPFYLFVGLIGRSFYHFFVSQFS